MQKCYEQTLQSVASSSEDFSWTHGKYNGTTHVAKIDVGAFGEVHMVIIISVIMGDAKFGLFRCEIMTSPRLGFRA